MIEKEDDAVKKLLIEYRNIINELRRREIIRTTKVVSDYGEYIAEKNSVSKDPQILAIKDMMQLMIKEENTK